VLVIKESISLLGSGYFSLLFQYTFWPGGFSGGSSARAIGELHLSRLKTPGVNPKQYPPEKMISVY
jgi:hypothetical protein